MITVHKIELVNFRSVPYALIEPNVDGGLTALAGGNGRGKSSVVMGIAWALYGITPPDVAVKGLRRQGSDGQECSVTVTFEHDGQIIEATRALKGRNDTTVAFIKVDGSEITNVSAKTAVKWMEARLGGLDATGFLTAFLVRQKEMDDLVKARPAERKKLVERLAGIERMSDAVQRAREAETDAKKLVVMLPGSPEEVTAAEVRLADADTDLTDAEKFQTEAQDLLTDLSDAADTAADEAATARADLDRVTGIRDRKTAMESTLALTRQDHGYAVLALDKKTEAAKNGSDDDLRDATDTYNAATTAYEDARVAEQEAASQRGILEGLSRSHATAVAENKTAALAEDDARKTYESAKEDAFATVAPSDEEITDAQDRHATAQAARADAQAEYRRLTTAIKTLTDSSHPACPTCNRDMENADAVIAGLNTALAIVTEQGAAAKKAEEDAAADLRTLTDLKSAATAAATALSTAERAFADATATAKAKRASLSDLEAQIADARQKVADAESASDPTYLSELNDKVTAAREHLTVVKAAAAARTELPALTKAVEDLAAKVTGIEQDIADLDAQIGGITVDAAAVTAMEAAARDAADAKSKQALAHQQAVSAVTVARAAVKTATDSVDQAKARLDAKAKAMTAWQEKTATREALEAFRADRLARIAPELAEVTTDLVTRMTNGRYVAVDMDESFTPILTDETGEQRPVSWLSGGEESIVALALRIGIGEIISGSKGGLLVLDEVLTAQDPDRRQSMIAAIRELPGRQVIMINHVAEALDIADKGYFFDIGDDDETIVVDLAHEESDVHLDHALDTD